MDVIANNPYRYLAVYSNSPIKERVGNRGKMNAFLKVGKTVSFPLDFSNILPAINRSIDSVTNAESQLTLPIDQIRFAQFWWMNLTSFDNIAFNHLMCGNKDMAKVIWDKKVNVSSLQNNFVLSCLNEEWASAIHYAEVLYANFSEEFITQIVGNDLSINIPLWQMLIDSFCEEKIDILPFIDVITNIEWRNYITEKTINPLINAITNVIETAKASKGKGPTIRLQAGQKLMTSTEGLLAQLKEILPASDIRFQTIADKLGLEILQCGIDYYNGSDAADAAPVAMKLQSHALSIVVGEMAKNRCKENVDILQKIIKNLPPEEVLAEDKAIKDELKKFCNLPNKICYSIDLLNSTKVHLQSIKAKLGVENPYYLKISTQVVNNALYNVIEEVNALQNDSSFMVNMILDKEVALSSVKSMLTSAWEAIEFMDTFDMEIDFKINRYRPNSTALLVLCTQAEVSTTIDIPHPSTLRPKPTNQSSTTPSATTKGTDTPAPKTMKRSPTTQTGYIGSFYKEQDGCFISIISWIVIGCILGIILEANGGKFVGGFVLSLVVIIIIIACIDVFQQK